MALAMPIDNAVVLRPAHVSERKALDALPPAAVVVNDPPADPEDVAKVFSAAHNRSKPVFSAGANLFLLTTGPKLDSPDRVEPGSLVRQGNSFHLTIVHTHVRLQDAPLLRNITWRPLAKVALPKDLAAGTYNVQVSWQPMDKVPDGQLLRPALVETASFEISPGHR
jgi:hypothetical protein